MSPNYYEILGLTDKSSQDEIKKAYRALSLKYHPDKTQNNPELLDKYQKINEAYETLGDEQKRREYDAMNNNPFLKMGMGMGQGPSPGDFANVDNIFSALFGQSPFQQGGFNQPGFFMHPGGGMPGVNIRMFRNGVPFNPHQGMEKPTPIVKNVTITMEQVLNGANIPIDIERWLVENGNKVFEHETIYLQIPKGIDENEIIMLREKGNISENGEKGDIKIFIKIENNTEFKRNGLDLILEKKVSLKEALCGLTFDMKFINGKNYTINNNPGSIIVPGYKKVIPNMGLKRDEHQGNLIIVFDVEFPTHLDAEKIAGLKDLL